MTARTVTLPGQRVATLVPADEAGEFSGYIEQEPAVLWRDHGFITPRQSEALMQLTRLYAISGGLTPWRHASGRGSDRAEAAAAEARVEWGRLCGMAPPRASWALLPACQGEWPIGRGMPLALSVSLDAVADALKLPV